MSRVRVNLYSTHFLGIIMLLQEIELLLEETENRRKVDKPTSMSRKFKDGLGYTVGGLPYHLVKHYNDEPSNPRVKSSFGRLAARFGGQVVGTATGMTLGAVGGTPGMMVGGTLGGTAGHMLGSIGKSGYSCPKGYKQDPNRTDHCIRE